MICPDLSSRMKQRRRRLSDFIEGFGANAFAHVATRTRIGEILFARRATFGERKNMLETKGFGRVIGGTAAVFAAMFGSGANQPLQSDRSIFAGHQSFIRRGSGVAPMIWCHRVSNGTARNCANSITASTRCALSSSRASIIANSSARSSSDNFPASHKGVNC